MELTAAFSKKVVTRTSSKSRSVTFTDLQPDTMYQVRVQAENGAGNGSSSSFVEFKTKASEKNESHCLSNQNDPGLQVTLCMPNKSSEVSPGTLAQLQYCL